MAARIQVRHMIPHDLSLPPCLPRNVALLTLLALRLPFGQPLALV